MRPVFNAEEILKIAGQIERNGAAFYEKAAESFGGEQRRRLLALAAMERVHEQLFTAMLRDLAESQGKPQMFDPDEEAERYLAAFAGGHVFDVNLDPVALLTGQQSLQDILKLALQLEKDSVVFYLGIKAAVPESLGKEQIDKVIREEMDHITVLSEALAASALTRKF